MGRISLDRRALIQRGLASASAGDSMVLHYQPVLTVASGRLDSVEALLRWDDPEIGPVNPAEFIPIAERYGEIQRIGAWVLDRACAQARRWLDAGCPRLIAINVSPRQLCTGTVVDEIKAALLRYELPSCWLEIELTEGAAVTDVPSAASQLRELIDAGIGVALDDYGTGNSSLATIKKLPLTRIKIDISLIHDIDTDPFAAAIVGALIHACRTLGLGTTAEGVEREKQLVILRDLHCEKAQGYLICRPVPASDLPRATASQSALPS